MKPLIIFLFSVSSLFVNLTFTYAADVNNNEDADIAFLPQTFDKEVKKPSDVIPMQEHDKTNNFQYSFDNTYQVNERKGHSSWNNLSRFGLQGSMPLNENTSFKTNLLLNAYTREKGGFKAVDDLRLDVKEAYLSKQQSPTLFFDIGRINIKSGVATGFNPTDYFKVGTLLDRKTEDVSQLRDARIGSLALRSQKLWDGGSLTWVASPKITQKPDHWTSDRNIVGLNLHKSNDRTRFMLTFNHKISDKFSPEIIYYNESGKHNLGINLSQSLNKQWITYAEWNIGKRRNLIDKALLKPRQNTRLSTNILQEFPTDSGEKYLQQLAIGASFTSSSNITTKIEYHYNQAGLSSSEADKWFTLINSADPRTVGQALSIRGLSQFRNEPLGQHSLFIRTNWNDALIDKLDLTGLLITNLNDDSKLIQLEAEYELNPRSSLALKLASFQGNDKSIYGSLNKDTSVTVKYSYDF